MKKKIQKITLTVTVVSESKEGLLETTEKTFEVDPSSFNLHEHKVKEASAVGTPYFLALSGTVLPVGEKLAG
jgi:hypothetical protein